MRVLGQNNGILSENCFFVKIWYNVHEDKEAYMRLGGIEYGHKKINYKSN